jgi:molybdopterin converting factor small subunit
MKTSKAKGRSRARVGSTGGSAFLAWFEEQAGKPRLNEADYLKLMRETVPQLRAELASAERELAEANRYRTAKQYALYAWCAKDSPNIGHEPRRT